MPPQLLNYRVERIREMISCGHTNMEIAIELSVSRQCVSHYRGLFRLNAIGLPRMEYGTTHDKRYFETDDQAEKFAAILDGRTFANDVRTKSTGRIGCPNPTLVITASNLERCG